MDTPLGGDTLTFENHAVDYSVRKSTLLNDYATDYAASNNQTCKQISVCPEHFDKYV